MEVHVTPLDQYIHSQVGPALQPGEQIVYFSTMRRQPGLFWQIVLVGGLLLVLMTKTYFAVLTNRRLILIRTKAGFFGTPKQMNLGVEEYDVRTFKRVTTSGMGNNRSMTFHTDSTKMTLRISPWFKSVSGTKDFFEQVPNLLNSGQLAHGQKQWLEIGMLLAQNPKVLLVDEPIAGMTHQESERTAELLKSLAGERTVVVVEHDMDFVRSIASKVTVLHQGSVLAEGDIDTVQNDPRVVEVYLGEPRT